MTDPTDDGDQSEPTEPPPGPSTKWQVELKADGVVGQGTSPWPVEENKDHL